MYDHYTGCIIVPNRPHSSQNMRVSEIWFWDIIVKQG